MYMEVKLKIKPHYFLLRLNNWKSETGESKDNWILNSYLYSLLTSLFNLFFIHRSTSYYYFDILWIFFLLQIKSSWSGLLARVLEQIKISWIKDIKTSDKSSVNTIKTDSKRQRKMYQTCVYLSHCAAVIAIERQTSISY